MRKTLMISLILMLAACGSENLDGKWTLDKEQTMSENKAHKDIAYIALGLEMIDDSYFNISSNMVEVLLMDTKDICAVIRENKNIIFSNCKNGQWSALDFVLKNGYLLFEDEGMAYYWKKE